MTLVLPNESKKIMKKCEELWNKIKDIIRSKTNNSDNYDKKYMKIKVNSDYDLPLNKTLGLCNMIIVVTAVFHEDNNYYPKVFSDECLCKL